MTNLRKCLGVTTFAVLALAFCCLIISQAAIASVDKVVSAANTDNSFESSVPLPTLGDIMRRGAGSALTDAVTAPKIDLGDSESRLLNERFGRTTAPIDQGAGMAKGVGDDMSDPIIIGDETALPYMATGDNSSGTNTHHTECEWTYADDGAFDDWYSFTPTVDMAIDVTLCNSTAGADLLLAVYEADLTTEVACSDDGCGSYLGGMASGIPVSAGVTYYVMVDGWFGWQGPYQLDVSEFIPPPYEVMCDVADFVEAEACADRTEIGCYGVGEFHDLRTVELDGYVICGQYNDDLLAETQASGISRDADWYLFEHTGSEPITISINYQSETGTVFCAGIMPGGTCPQGNWFGWGLPGHYNFDSDPVVLFPGDVFTVYMRANSFGPDCINDGADQGKYWMILTTGALTPVDDCPLALDITGDTEVGVPIVQDLCGMTADGPFAGPYQIYGDYPYAGNAWFRWECEESGIYTISTCNTPAVFVAGDPEALPDPIPDAWVSYDLFMGIFNDGCPPAQNSEVGFSDDGLACPGYEPEATFIAAAGLSYLITVASWTAPPYAADGSVCGEVWLDISHVELPLYWDDCENERLVVDAPIEDMFFNNLNATPDGPDVSYCNSLPLGGGLGGDLWFEVIAWETGYVTMDFLHLNFDVNMEVYAGGDCIDPVNPRKPIYCNDDGGDADDARWDATADTWPVGHGSWASLPCTAGDVFMVRVGGWYNPPANPLSDGGMGFGYFSIVIDANGPGPANDHCSDVTPVELTDGFAETFVGDTYWATWNDCFNIWPDYPMSLTDGPVWEAFSVPSDVCMDVVIDFCDTERAAGESRYLGGVGTIWTGCPCENDFVAITATSTASYTAECENGYIYTFAGMATGSYYIQIDFNMHMLDETFDDYVINVTGTIIEECYYCESTTNGGTLPPVSGGTWIQDFSLADIATVGEPLVMVEEGPPQVYTGAFNSVAPFDVDNTAMVAHMYRGITYEAEVVMDKFGPPANEHDSCDIWIDWNQNTSLYDPLERITLERIALTWTADITVPTTALLPGEGISTTTRMVVRLSNDLDGAAAICGVRAFGEVERYTVEVVAIECGDFNIDGLTNADDVTFLRDWYFGGTTAPDYWQRADIDGDGMITIADVIALVEAAYNGGPKICI